MESSEILGWFSKAQMKLLEKTSKIRRSSVPQATIHETVSHSEAESDFESLPGNTKIFKTIFNPNTTHSIEIQTRMI